MKIIKARIEDISLLNKLTYDSKSSWWYSKEQMEDWKEGLKIYPDDIINNHTYILTTKWWIIVWYTTFIFKENGIIYIKNLFIHKDYLRNWYWSLLLNFIKQEWQNQWVLEIYLESDKNAMNFYLKNWFLVSWESKDSWLPLMKYSLW